MSRGSRSGFRLPTPASEKIFLTPDCFSTQKTCLEDSPLDTPSRQPCNLTVIQRLPAEVSKSMKGGEDPNGVSKTRSSSRTRALAFASSGNEHPCVPEPPMTPQAASGNPALITTSISCLNTRLAFAHGCHCHMYTG